MTTRTGNVYGDAEVDRSFRRMRRAMNNMMRDFENDFGGFGLGDWERRFDVPLLGQATQTPTQTAITPQQPLKATQLTPFSGRGLDVWSSPHALYWPAIDFVENDNNFQLTADVPGLQKGEIDITVQGNNLVLKGEHKEEKKDEQQNYYYRERRCGKFERCIPLPSMVDAKGITAVHDHGQLTVTLPKNAEAHQKINVQ